MRRSRYPASARSVDYIAQASAKIKRLFGADGSQPPRKRRKNAVRKSSGLTKNAPPVPHEERIKDIREQIDADTLELHYAQGNVEMAVEALAELKYEKASRLKATIFRWKIVKQLLRVWLVSIFLISLVKKRMFSRAARKIRSLTVVLYCMIT